MSTLARTPGLTGLLASWGVTLDKDLVLEQNPVGQIVGVGPEVPLVSNYESQPIVNDLKNHFTGFPVTRSLGSEERRQRRPSRSCSQPPIRRSPLTS